MQRIPIRYFIKLVFLNGNKCIGASQSVLLAVCNVLDTPNDTDTICCQASCVDAASAGWQGWLKVCPCIVLCGRKQAGKQTLVMRLAEKCLAAVKNFI